MFAPPPASGFNRDAFFARLDATPGYLGEGQRRTFNRLLDGCAGLSLSRLAYVLGTAAHETGKSFDCATEEGLNYGIPGLMSTFSRDRISAADCNRLGRKLPRLADKPGIANVIYGGPWGLANLGNDKPGDGWKYRGRGLVQITGKANYGKIGKKLGLDQALVADPDRVWEEAVAIPIAIRGMTEGWFRGVGLDDRLPVGRPASRAEFIAARDIINGGRDKAPEIAAVALEFQAILIATGWTPA
jgi:predicted chitinase